MPIHLPKPEKGGGQMRKCWGRSHAKMQVQLKSSLSLIPRELRSLSGTPELFLTEAEGPGFYTPVLVSHWLCGCPGGDA